MKKTLEKIFDRLFIKGRSKKKRDVTIIVKHELLRSFILDYIDKVEKPKNLVMYEYEDSVKRTVTVIQGTFSTTFCNAFIEQFGHFLKTTLLKFEMDD